MTEQDKEAEIARLKEEAIALKEKIDARLASGEVELSDAARAQIVAASNQQLQFKTSNEVLKDLGVSRATRRRLAHMRRTKPHVAPKHTQRAQAVADRQAILRQEKVAA